MPARLTAVKNAFPFVLGAATFAAGVIVGASLVNLNTDKK